MRDSHHRRSIRLDGYDYTHPGAYFVTIVTSDRLKVFGEVVDGEVRLNLFGEIVKDAWLRLDRLFPVEMDDWVIMPNHFHGIIYILEPEIGCCRGEADGTEIGRGSGRGEAGGRGAILLHCRFVPPASPLPPRDAHQTHRASGTHPGSLGAIVQNFKSLTTRRINQIRRTPGQPVWQRNYYEHIIRGEEQLSRLRRYILENPTRWDEDDENPNHLPEAHP